MAKIDVNLITLSDAGSANPPIPNVVPSSAERLRLRVGATELPAGTRKVKIVVTIFQPAGHPRVGGWFNTRVRHTEPLDTTFEVPNNDPRIFEICIHHPDHFTRAPSWGYFRKAIATLFLGTSLAHLIRFLFSHRWHDGPGPYDTEVTMTAADQQGTTIPGSEATFQYPFISV